MSAEPNMAAAAAEGICDWCHASGVVVAWPVPEITLEGPARRVVMGHGTWAACAECRPLVEAHDVDGLLERFRTQWAVSHGSADPQGLAVTRAVMAMVDRVRGEAVPVGASPEWV